jgi:hypothetical protein
MDRVPLNIAIDICKRIGVHDLVEPILTMERPEFESDWTDVEVQDKGFETVSAAVDNGNVPVQPQEEIPETASPVIDVNIPVEEIFELDSRLIEETSERIEIENENVDTDMIHQLVPRNKDGKILCEDTDSKEDANVTKDADINIQSDIISEDSNCDDDADINFKSNSFENPESPSMCDQEIQNIDSNEVEHIPFKELSEDEKKVNNKPNVTLREIQNVNGCNTSLFFIPKFKH